MNRNEMIMLIRANDAIMELDRLITAIIKKGSLTGSKFDDMLRVAEVIYQNCPFYDPDKDENFARFMEILSEDGLTAEEKYERLMGESGKDQSIQNYTEWQRERFDGVDPESFYREAVDYAAKNPFPNGSKSETEEGLLKGTKI